MIIADSNVLIDILDQDCAWSEWSMQQLQNDPALDICINPVIYAEISPQFASVAEVDAFLRETRVAVNDFTPQELFLAGTIHKRYRTNGGERKRVLADFMIGAQAAVDRRAILTRDPKIFRSYFPTVELITP